MTKIKLLSIAVVGLLLINFGILAFLFLQKPSSSERGPKHHRPREIIIRKLKFDDEQVNKYDDLIHQHRSAIRILDDSVRDLKTTLYSTLIDKSTSHDSIIQAIAEVQKRIETVHYVHFTQIKSICKPEQIDYFKDLTRELSRLFAPGKNFPPPPRD
jgi:periplasmic protein CpxP/Spy